MFTLKPLSREGIAAALEKAMRYRLLNEPGEAESICLDIRAVDPENQQAITTLILAITDQFGRETGGDGKFRQARELLPSLQGEYDRFYYAGIICERQAKAILNRGIPGGKHMAYEGFREAMDYFDKAEAVRPSGNDDAILRWNTCVRFIARYNLSERQEEPVVTLLE